MRIQIDGDKFEWEANELELNASVKKEKPKPNTPPVWVLAYEYQLLVDNDVGIVAALPEAYEDHFGDHLGAWVITISKPSGAYGLATIEYGGHEVRREGEGHCELKSDAPLIEGTPLIRVDPRG